MKKKIITKHTSSFLFTQFKYFFSIKNKLNMTKIKLYKFPHNTKYDLYYAP